MSIWNGSPQRELATNTLSGKLGADHKNIVDRLLHHCEVILINGPSYRLKNRLAAVETTINSATA